MHASSSTSTSLGGPLQMQQQQGGGQEVSDEEIAREVRTLRNLRRRSGSSTGPGALPLDPDLPPPSPSSSQAYPEPYSSNDDITLSTSDGLEGNASGLFWVPAHLHPELAPGEFRAFLKSHTHADPENADITGAGETAGMARSPSWLARNGSRKGASDGGLGRKRSMLSRQYQPKAGDNIEEEVPPLPTRQRASIYGGRSGEKGLTLQDLQKLEMLVDEAGEEDDPDSMRRALRRSLSMNVAPGFLQDDIPQHPEEGLAPPARPGSILRRSARTKIRKANLVGDGGGHRFAATRKGRMTAAPVIDIPGLQDDDYASTSPTRRLSDESSSEAHQRMDSVDSHEDEDEQFHEASEHIEDMSRRPSESSTDENYIFDAYARDSRSSSMSGESSSRSESPSLEDSPPGLRLELPSIPRSTSGGQNWFDDEQKTPTQERSMDPLHGIRRPSPSEALEDRERPGAAHLPGSISLSVPGEGGRAGPPSPTTPHAKTLDLPPGMAPPATRTSIHQQHPVKEQPLAPQPLPPSAQLARTDSASSTPSIPAPSKDKSKEKEKKGGLFGKKDKDKDKKKKEKDGFLGSLFGGNKKKQEEPSSVANFSSAGPAAAAALLGSSKSAKSLGVTPGASPTSPGFNSFARYPIHVERAVYRLSHIKLANARRPLYEQVLISNLMFWYLGVIGRNVAEEKKNAEEEKKEVKTPPAKGTPPKSADVGSAGKPLPHQSPPESTATTPTQSNPVPLPSGKKTGLTKPDRSRGGRDAEAPVRPPQYGAQNAQVDSELRSASMKGPRPQGPPQPINTQPPPHQRGEGSQPPYAPLQQQNQRQPPTHRALSPPSPGQQSRPTSEYGPSGPRDPRHNSPSPDGMNASHSMGDVRQRTYSNPVPPPSQQPYPANSNARRVVSEAQPGNPHLQGLPPGARPPPQAIRPQHSGPQPGQLFHHPGPQSPGQFPPRPLPNGQAPPRYPPGAGPGPQPAGMPFHNGPQPGQIFRPPMQQQRPPPNWAPDQRMPPQQEYGQVPPHMRRPNGPPAPPMDGRSYSAPYPSQGQPPHMAQSHSVGPGGQPYYPRPPPQQQFGSQPGQIFNGYPPGARPANPEDFRRAQPVQQGGGQYGHHR